MLNVSAMALTAVMGLTGPRPQDVLPPPPPKPPVVLHHGRASHYEDCQPTASGRKFRPWSEKTCAHRSLPFGTKLKVSRGDCSVVVEVTDRGPYDYSRVLDLTPEAFRCLAPLDKGVISVEWQVIE